MSPHGCRSRRFVLGLLAACLALTPARPATALHRDVYKEIRSRYEGLTLRLRIDLRVSDTPMAANVVSLSGVGHGRESSPVLFTALEEVFVQRVSNDGRDQIAFALYRSEDESRFLRSVPSPLPGYPPTSTGGSLPGFARQGSTELVFQVRAAKKEPGLQREEMETLLQRAFYLGDAEPTTGELEAFVRRHSSLPLSRLQALTGLPAERIRDLLQAAD